MWPRLIHELHSVKTDQGQQEKGPQTIPSDSFLFANLKIQLDGKKFSSCEGGITAVDGLSLHLTISTFVTGLDNWELGGPSVQPSTEAML